MCTDDVDAVLPVVLDFAPVSSFDREFNTGVEGRGDRDDRDHTSTTR